MRYDVCHLWRLRNIKCHKPRQVYIRTYVTVYIVLWEVLAANLFRWQSIASNDNNAFVAARMTFHQPPAFVTLMTASRTKLTLQQDQYLQSDVCEPNLNGMKHSDAERKQQQQHLYLLSLQWPDGDLATESNDNKFSKAVADIWRWKDLVLGDGRDFFIPRPRTIRALQSYLSTHHDRGENRHHYVISECVVLSNCARFEILLVVNTNHYNITPNTFMVNRKDFHTGNDVNRQQLTNDVVTGISSMLVRQVQSHHKYGNNVISHATTSLLDWPGAIDPIASHTLHSLDDEYNVTAKIQDVSKFWTIRSGSRDMVHHLCLVAVGMASRPRRPNREIVFRPFSSRDAHILLQLKRTADIITSSPHWTKPSKNMLPKTSYLLTLLQFALRAGKAARNPNKLPALMELRDRYGETGNSPKYDIEPPIETMQKVIQVGSFMFPLTCY
jgi:hypothetical protein